jgi:putative inorganic carbon (HCO3(-)) transporter
MRLSLSDSDIRYYPYYLMIISAGCLTGFITCLAAGMQLKWFIAYLIGISMVITLALSSQQRRLALGLFILFIPFFIAKRIFSSQYPMITGGPSSIGLFLYDIPLTFLLVLFVKERVLRRNSSFYIPKVFFPFFLYIIWSGVSIINSIEPLLTLIEFIWLCKMAIILILVVNLIKDRNDLLLVFSLLLVGLFIQEIITFSQAYLKIWYTFGGDIEATTFQTATQKEVFRAGGAFGPHNVQSAYYALLIPLAMGLFFSIRTRRLKFVLVLLILGGLYSLTLTYSRNGYLSVASAIVVIVFLAWRKNVLNWKHLMVGVWLLITVGGLIIPIWGGDFIDRITSFKAIEPRWEGVKIALNMIRNHPLVGVGLNNYAIAMADRNYTPEGISSLQQAYFQGQYFATVVHNKYLLVTSETGMMGLGIFLWTLYIVYSYAFRLLASEKTFYWAIGTGMVGALVGASIQMLFDIYNADLLITLFWVLVGLTFASYKISLGE